MSNAIKKVVRNRAKATNQKLRRISHETLPTSYLQALFSPEYAINPKVPHQLSKETISLSRHITVPITANVLGNAAILFSPFLLKDDATTISALYVNNTATYDGVSTFGTGYTALATPQQIPANNVAAYRLVSAAMHIVPQMSLTTATGKIGGCVTDFLLNPTTVGLTVGTWNTAATIAYLETLRPYAEADVCVPESLRLVWYPYDINDLAMYDINYPQPGSNSILERENVMAAYITGAPASAKFNLELFWNFEVTPVPGSILSGMGTYCMENVDPIDELKKFKSQPKAIAHAYVSTNHFHQADGRSFALSTGNPTTRQQTVGSAITEAEALTKLTAYANALGFRSKKK